VKTISQTLLMLLVFTVLTGVVYPGGVWIVGQLAFASKANGSLIVENGVVKGSSLIGQKFENDRYFFSRPSASDYGAVPSRASNLGPTSLVLRNQIIKRQIELGAKHLTKSELVPVDLVTCSASGLDPHISAGAARFQIARVAQARHLDASQTAALKQLVKKHIEAPQWNVFGNPRVNVLDLNMALDKAFL
jgi:K+-transporting ATPase ATPase C chain